MVRRLDPAAGPATENRGEVGTGIRTTAKHETRNMDDKFKKFGAALMALALIGAGLGMVSAAPGSIDGTQTDTSDEVYVSDEKTMDDEFNASGDTEWNLTLQSVPEDADVAMNVTHDGVEYYAFTGDFGDYADGDPDADATTVGKYHAFTDDELSRVPMGVHENVSLTITWWNASADSPTPENATVYVNNTDERSVQRITENASAVDVETASAPLYKAWQDDYTAVSVDSEDVEVNGSETDIIYTLSDSTVQDPFANMTESVGVESTGAFTFMIADVDAEESNPVPVFYKSTPDWYDAENMGTYATFDPDGDTITVHTEDTEFEDADSAGVSMSSDVYRVSDIGTVWNLAGGYSGGGVGAVINMVM